jgi:hypothetical protein
MNTARYVFGSAGATNTAALGFGGQEAPTATEKWNGTSWTTVTSLNTGGIYNNGAGTNTAALSFAGTSSVTESWNGTAWSPGPLTNTPAILRGGTGTQTAALAFGGGPTFITATEEWSGPAVQTVNITVS